jgi:hypothetical protein
LRRWYDTHRIKEELKELDSLVVSPVFERISQHIQNQDEEIERLKKELELERSQKTI